jgi:hypothetical protein
MLQSWWEGITKNQACNQLSKQMICPFLVVVFTAMISMSEAARGVCFRCCKNLVEHTPEITQGLEMCVSFLRSGTHFGWL